MKQYSLEIELNISARFIRATYSRRHLLVGAAFFVVALYIANVRGLGQSICRFL